MPIYEYLCDQCETRFERIAIKKQAETACPKCSSKKVKVQPSVFATPHGSLNAASASAKPSRSFDGGGNCCGGSCGCH